ncbi:hypothetical protein RDWZM_005717 [Blomia tropicalis]|uniref:Post-GPI attachment to proteins factor 3 n=1 Tax=Blomia tropicalis TaxID=40697 RepID=A0A9Q0MA39_BLOTA|nr:hypothetical protein RDWZM_005717 [Blomia tropicalis]
MFWCQITFLIFFILAISNVLGSLGDRLIIYRNELQSCLEANCSSPTLLNQFYSSQLFFMKLFGWDCLDECRYQSQWYTLEELRRHNYTQVPQFYGKWTFYRFYGIQEPASFFFSLLNLFANLFGWLRYCRFTEKLDPLYSVWKIQTFLTINAWFWSTVYHGRDTIISEKLDYYSAYSVIIFFLCAIAIKMLSQYTNNSLTFITVSMPFLAFYIYHTIYLHLIHFDYGYNMKVNVATGLLSTIGWLFWCVQNRSNRKHIWKCYLSLLGINFGLILELFDFPPIAFTFDAHSLWHLWTIPFSLVWFSFLTDEAHYLTKNLHIESKKKIV